MGRLSRSEYHTPVVERKQSRPPVNEVISMYTVVSIRQRKNIAAYSTTRVFIAKNFKPRVGE